ncbi:putative protein TPRXL isoform X2 [Strongylocentrotus purpuratus]|uniref:Uncharacterized protein n=1 Tax=Strongylocentrotus purpuratus TaxID=7668 RepID=A0A7M7N3N6_STRPU|nr:putative protein TPRXL isoform X2 [Strongylocentrotus purpuratus]
MIVLPFLCFILISLGNGDDSSGNGDDSSGNGDDSSGNGDDSSGNGDDSSGSRKSKSSSKSSSSSSESGERNNNGGNGDDSSGSRKSKSSSKSSSSSSESGERNNNGGNGDDSSGSRKSKSSSKSSSSSSESGERNNNGDPAPAPGSSPPSEYVECATGPQLIAQVDPPFTLSFNINSNSDVFVITFCPTSVLSTESCYTMRLSSIGPSVINQGPNAACDPVELPFIRKNKKERITVVINSKRCTVSNNRGGTLLIADPDEGRFRFVYGSCLNGNRCRIHCVR